MWARDPFWLFPIYFPLILLVNDCYYCAVGCYFIVITFPESNWRSEDGPVRSISNVGSRSIIVGRQSISLRFPPEGGGQPSFFFSFNVSWCTQFLPAHHGGRHHGTRVAITRSFSVFRQGPSWNTQRKWNLKNGRNDGRLARTHAMFDFVTIKVGADFVATPLDGSIRSIWKKKKFGPFFKKKLF